MSLAVVAGTGFLCSCPSVENSEPLPSAVVVAAADDEGAADGALFVLLSTLASYYFDVIYGLYFDAGVVAASVDDVAVVVAAVDDEGVADGALFVLLSTQASYYFDVIYGLYFDAGAVAASVDDVAVVVAVAAAVVDAAVVGVDNYDGVEDDYSYDVVAAAAVVVVVVEFFVSAEQFVEDILYLVGYLFLLCVSVTTALQVLPAQLVVQLFFW